MSDIPQREKLTSRLDVPIGEEFKEVLAALAVVMGYGSTAEYVRDILTKVVYGEAPMLEEYRRRRAAARGSASHE